MANFDLDDPLGDLLSDGSDDSFFAEPKAAKRASISKSPDKKKVSDLFGLEEPSSKKESQEDWLGLKAAKNAEPATTKKSIAASPSTTRPKTAKKISFEDDDNTDILNTLGLDPKSQSETRTRNDPVKKSAVLESILGPSPGSKDNEKKSYSLDDLLQETKAMKRNEKRDADVTQSSLQLTQSKPATATSSSGGFSGGLLASDAPREGRRGRGRSVNISDPLGLFESSKSELEKGELESASGRIEPGKGRREAQRKEQPPVEILFQENRNKSQSETNISSVPDWLGGSQKSSEQIWEKTGTLPVAVTDNKILEEQNQQENQTKQHLYQGKQLSVDQENVPLPLESLLTQQKLASSNLEYQNASAALQQQESQLLMALQMKKYEENLNSMQRKQQDVLVKQEQQFNTLLERQFAKQQALESNMRLQQERINGHIQLLLSGSGFNELSQEERNEKVEELKKGNTEELERQYEEMISHLKQRQHEEMFLLEESYKKQITTIEQSMESIEKHLKTELDAMAQKHREKLDHLDEEHKLELEKYRQKIEDLHKQHANELRQIRENNSRVVEEVKFEYNTILENLKSSRNAEQQIVQNANEYSTKLERSLGVLDLNSKSLEEIREKVAKDFGVLSSAREESLKAKEREIGLMRETLEKSRELADQERAQLMSLVRNLEVKLAEQSQNSREERFALQQAAATLTARTAALEREADFNRQSIERERAQLNTLRESILSEQEKCLQEITEEKLALHTQKVRLETAAKVGGQNFDSLRAKAEMDAAVQVAKEATDLTDKERENLIKQVREVEILKRQLKDKENCLYGRERDLEVAIEQANRKSLIGEKALEEARMMQSKYNENLREIQAHVASLHSREKKLAEDKIAVSRERLALHNSAKQIRRCGLCAVDNNIPRMEPQDEGEEGFAAMEPVEHDIPRFISVSDADIFRLQLQMSEEQLTSTHGIEDEHQSVHYSLK